MGGDELEKLIEEAHGWNADRPRFSEADRLAEERSAKPETLEAIRAEVVRARTKFPGNAKMLAALVEEVGELAQALLQRKPVEQIRREATQVACVAVRIIEEGDADFASGEWGDAP